MAQRLSVVGAERSEASRAEVIALVASAGGLEAVTKVLRDVPVDTPAAVVVAQHLGGQGSTLVEILRRRVALPVDWAVDGGRIEAGSVTVAPPRSVLEVLPDGSCVVRASEGTLVERPLDALLASVGDSFGSRAWASS